MKKSKLVLALVSTLITLGASASSKTVFDTDGFDRLTKYSSGPVSSAVIASEHAHQLEVYLFRDELGSDCASANVYDLHSGQNLAVGHIGYVGGSDGRIRNVLAEIPEEFLQTQKVLEAECTNAQGEEFSVRVNIPGAPIISWEAHVEPTGEFIYQNYSYSYHSSYKVTSRINVNNQSVNGFCQSTQTQGVALNLFHGNTGKGNFHSDVFTASKEVNNAVSPQPVLHQSIECAGTGGKTKLIKVWDLTDENSIQLMHDELIVL